MKIIRSNRRSISLQVTHNGEMVVKAPMRAPQFLIDKFISDNSDWIEKQKAKLKKQEITKKSYSEGELFLFMGKELKVEIGAYTVIKIQGDTLLFPRSLQFRMKKELDVWRIKQAKEFITSQVEYWAKQMNTSYKIISFSDTTSKWGSCTQDNRLQFSWRLIMAPLMVINYVIIHELTHTTIKNHSREFWSRVNTYTPSYRQQVKWLKANGNLLFV